MEKSNVLRINKISYPDYCIATCAEYHGDIDKKTPAELAGILVDGNNKWKTIIQNASLSQYQ